MTTTIIAEKQAEKKLLLVKNDLYTFGLRLQNSLLFREGYYTFIIMLLALIIFKQWLWMETLAGFYGLFFIANFAVLTAVQLLEDYKHPHTNIYFLTPGKEKVLEKKASLVRMDNTMFLVSLFVFIMTFIGPLYIGMSMTASGGNQFFLSITICLLAFGSYYFNSFFEDYYKQYYPIHNFNRFNDLTILLS